MCDGLTVSISCIWHLVPVRSFSWASGDMVARGMVFLEICWILILWRFDMSCQLWCISTLVSRFHGFVITKQSYFGRGWTNRCKFSVLWQIQYVSFIKFACTRFDTTCARCKAKHFFHLENCLEQPRSQRSTETRSKVSDSTLFTLCLYFK